MGVKSSEMGAKINFYPKGLHMSEIYCTFARQMRAELNDNKGFHTILQRQQSTCCLG